MERGSYLASRYDPDRIKAYHLGILTGQGVSAWAVHDVADGSMMALGWGSDSVALDDGNLPRHPASVSFVSLPEWSTLVPDGALAPGSEARHLALVHGRMPSGAMRDEPVRSLGATCIYVHDDRNERAVLDRFPHARPMPMQALMIRAAQARVVTSTVVLTHRGADRLDVCIARPDGIRLTNTYPVRTGQDVLYFVLLAIEQAGERPEQVELYTSGTHLSSMERDLLNRYFQRSAPAVTMPFQGIEPTADQAPDRWMAAMEQFACVS